MLAGGHHVADYSRTAPLVDGVEFIQGDIADAERLAECVRGYDSIIHLAAVPGPRRATPAQLLQTNIIGLVNVLEGAVQAGVPQVVFASSGAATGFSFQVSRLMPRYLPLDEAHPAEPEDEYGLSKLLGELTCKRYSAAFSLRTICLRINHNWCLDRAGAEIAVRSGWAKAFSSVEDLWTRRYLKVIRDDGGDWPIPGPPAPWNLLWAVTDIRDAAQAFRLAVENQNISHAVFQINGADTCSRVESKTLVERYYPAVPLRAPLEGYATLVSHDQATRQLSYHPRYTWRKSEFSEWMRGVRETK
jgi:nucleoside-diphosphate-sugar epimerase